MIDALAAGDGMLTEVMLSAVYSSAQNMTLGSQGDREKPSGA